MPEKARQKFSQFLLPGKTLKIFGVDEERLSNLEYEMDFERSRDKDKYKVFYNLYINRRSPQNGGIELSALQFF